MIDTDKYEGHTPAPWILMKDGSYERYIALEPDDDYYEGEARVVLHNSCERGFRVNDAQLIADAPLLLAEVKRLRGLLMKGSENYTTSYMDLRNIIEDVHWELTGDEHDSNEKRIKYALISLREVIE